MPSPRSDTASDVSSLESGGIISVKSPLRASCYSALPDDDRYSDDSSDDDQLIVVLKKPEMRSRSGRKKDSNPIFFKEPKSISNSTKKQQCRSLSPFQIKSSGQFSPQNVDEGRKKEEKEEKEEKENVYYRQPVS